MIDYSHQNKTILRNVNLKYYCFPITAVTEVLVKPTWQIKL